VSIHCFLVAVFNSQRTFYAGNEVTVVAAYPDRTPQDRIRATYSIDGRRGDFSIQNGGVASDFYRRVVRIYDISNGEHTLELTFNGGINDIPLVLVEFWVKEGTHPYQRGWAYLYVPGLVCRSSPAQRGQEPGASLEYLPFSAPSQACWCLMFLLRYINGKGKLEVEDGHFRFGISTKRGSRLR
jgi:hypothetical protein